MKQKIVKSFKISIFICIVILFLISVIDMPQKRTESEFQTPSSKLQETKKSQIPNSKLQGTKDRTLKPKSIKYPIRNEDNSKTEVKKELKIKQDIEVAFVPKDKKMNFQNSNIYPRCAIIVDDFGIMQKGTHEILNLNYPLTISIIPNLKYSEEIARIAKMKNFEVIVHLPMESKNEKENQRLPVITADMSEENIREFTKIAFESIPGAVGFNNHMGSKVTPLISVMETVLDVAKSKNFFYIDSLTTPNSVGYSVAKDMGIRTKKNDIFLDRIKNEKYIESQIKKLILYAKSKGTAIGICHVNLHTASALKRMLPMIEKHGVKIVPVSELLE